jgi:hypothetical protein
MLPRRLTKTLGPDTDDRLWGIGTHPWPVNGLSDLAFGHAGYTKCTVCIDPVHDLAVIMLRDAAGKNFNKYNPLFLQAVVDGLVDKLPAFPRALTFADMKVPPGEKRIALDTVVENDGSAAAVIDYEYATAGTGWKITPDTGRSRVPPHGKVPLHVEAAFDNAQPAPIPKLWGSVAYEGQAVPKVEYWLQPRLERRTTAIRLARPPTVDGTIADGEYPGAGLAGAFLEPKGRRKPPYDTQFQVAYDDKALYLAVTAFEKDPRGIRRTPRQRDDRKIQSDDCIEVILDAAHDRKAYRHFVVNLDGAQLDALGGDSKNWHAAWEAPVKTYEDRYVVEMAIPYEALGAPPPKPGDTWRMNICRHRTAPDPWSPESNSQWVPSYDRQMRPLVIWDSYDNPDLDHYFGEVTFK